MRPTGIGAGRAVFVYGLVAWFGWTGRRGENRRKGCRRHQSPAEL